MRWYVLALVAVGCNSVSLTRVDGGVSGTLCTTAACAAAPCTTGCVFTAPVNGSCHGSASIDASVAQACVGFCGFLTCANGAGCGVYDGNASGCQLCGARWGDASCVVQDPAIDYYQGAAICSAGDQCWTGCPVPDMGCVH